MRRLVYVLVSGLLLAGWLVLGSTTHPFGTPLPALGRLLSPTQGLWRSGHPDLIQARDQDLSQIDHPLATGTIFLDGRGVPHLFAEDRNSAYFLQGYAHASERLWQMDISTRATEGRLSEVLGERTRERDLEQIRLGYRHVARYTVDTLRAHFPNDLSVLQAYSDGVNAYLDQLAPSDYPIEYKLLGHVPLRWSPYRCVLLQKGMSQGLSGRYRDAENSATLAHIGPELFRDLFPERFAGDSPVVPTGARVPTNQNVPAASPTLFNQVETTLRHERPVNPYLPFPPDPDNGSNNFAVAGRRSATGSPLLANDPHLRLALPSIWAEAQIVYPGCNARGVGIPGAPGLMMGFNDNIAWGETNVGHDVTDWFAINWVDEDWTQYRLDGAVAGAEVVTDTLRVRGEADVLVKTPWTVFGPVPFTEGPYAGRAMRYLAYYEPGVGRTTTGVTTFVQLPEARNYTDYVNALRGYVDPAQNFLFAARDGDIAIRPNGYFPLRGPGQTGRFLSPGDSTKYNWRAYVPFAERPVHYNPARGFVSSANQVTTGPDYPYPYYGYFDEYRGRNINRQLAGTPTATHRSMKELQLSSYSLLAEELAPLLLARVDRVHVDAEGRRLLRLLAEWDYHYTGESRAATLFDRWRSKLYHYAFADEFPDSLNVQRPEYWRFVELVRTRPNHPVFDDITTPDFRETEAMLTQRAFDEVLEELAGELPPRWFEERNARIGHLGQIPGFGSEIITTGGARSTPRVVANGFGASWRMVVELGERPRAWGTLPGGPSGNPGSEFYTSDLDDWVNGRYHELTRWVTAEQAAGAAVAAWRF